MKLLQDMKEVFKTLSHRKPTKIYCPRCGSRRIHLSSSLNYWLTPKKYFCEKCGYNGPIALELEKEEIQQ
ncbi:hypothetical protein E3J49_01685 [Candidatus Bathyarchaeota archaeon]|nr:hypothetical protein [Candidatus Bathyarchaeota archaeon]MCK4434608.1 hypothetical protein [Candidatus Bathyarchaeota archaeon]TET65457.1 MAG: hypothetical protein E3J49_01685 [Candidatus Bathyarchaeota archaeon]